VRGVHFPASSAVYCGAGWCGVGFSDSGIRLFICVCILYVHRGSRWVTFDVLQFPEACLSLLRSLDVLDIAGVKEEAGPVDLVRMVLDASERLGVTRYLEPNDVLQSTRLCYCLLGELFNVRSGLSAPVNMRQRLSLPTVSESIDVMEGNPPVSVQAEGRAGYPEVMNRQYVAEEVEVAEVAALPAGEMVAFARYVNAALAGNVAVAEYLPLDVYGDDLHVCLSNVIFVSELRKAGGLRDGFLVSHCRTSFCEVTKPIR
jgi:hypothetical protein